MKLVINRELGSDVVLFVDTLACVLSVLSFESLWDKQDFLSPFIFFSYLSYKIFLKIKLRTVSKSESR